VDLGITESTTHDTMKEEPTPRPASVLKAKLVGVAVAFGGLCLVCGSIDFPVDPAKHVFRMWHLHAAVTGTLIFYVGMALLLTDCSNHKIKCVGPDGRPLYTRRGRIIMLFICAASAISLVAEYLYVLSLGLRVL
jgi:hypothetical protein